MKKKIMVFSGAGLSKESYMKSDRYGNYTSALEDFLGYYKADKSVKKEETPQERDTRLLREKAEAREAKIDQILKK